MRKYYSKEQYVEALKLRQKFSRKEIAEKLSINFHTLGTWFYLNSKPHCISKKWKNRQKYVYKNLGKYAIPKEIFIPNLKTSQELAYFIGVYLGDGNSYRGFDMVSIDYGFAKKVADILSEISNKEIISKPYQRFHKNGQKEEGYRIRLSSVILKKYLERITDKKKIIPKVIFKSNDDVKWALFSGFLDSEGTIKHPSTNKKRGVISLSQKDKSLLIQFKYLLSLLGIYAGIAKDRNYFELKIYGVNHLKNILKNGGFIQTNKQKKLMKIIEYSNKSNKKYWTKEEEFFLIESKYNRVKTKEIAKNLGRTYHSIYGKFQRVNGVL
ncbi:hypothetical protein HY448_02330 [Candidatus Pacearchaeota archaeon]|nr:hypothetical protein [Candidatus Pacearchaeota archaeon]